MMNEYEVYTLAWRQQLQVWGKEYDMLQKLPDNKLTIARERKAKERLDWLSDRLRDLAAAM